MYYFQVLSNTFICDPCVSQLETAHIFKEKCIEIFSKSSEQVDSACSLQSETIEDNTFVEDIVYEEEYVDDAHYIKSELTMDDDEVTVSYEDYANEMEAPNTNNCTTYSSELEQEAKQSDTSNPQADEILIVDNSFIRNWQHKSNIYANQENLSGTDVGEEPCNLDGQNKCAPRTVKNRKCYPSGKKLEVVECAERTGNRKAAKIFSIDESCIRKWRLNKELLIEIDQERGTMRKPNLHWPELDIMLKGWVKDKMNSGILLKPAEIKAKSIEIANALNLKDFRGSSSYIFKFMGRYQIPGRPAKNPMIRKTLQIE